MKKLSILQYVLSIVLTGVFLSVHNGNAQVTIMESTGSVLHLKWKIDGVDTSTVLENGSEVTELSFRGQNTALQVAWSLLPGYRLWVGVPSVGNAVVSFVPEMVQNINIRYPLSKKSPVESSGVAGLSDVEWVPEIRYHMLRDLRAVALVICPVKCNPDGTVMVCTKGEVIVTFPPGSNAVQRLRDNDYEKMLSALLVNYETAKWWRKPVVVGKRKSAGSFPLDNRKVYHFRVGDGHTGFNEGTITENGCIRISGIEIMSIFGISAISDIQLYGSDKGGLPENHPGAIPLGLMEIPLLRVDKNGNNLVDSTDYLIAYVTGTSDWHYVNGDFAMNIDRYDDYRHYWLIKGNGGSTIKKTEKIDALAAPEDSFTDRICFRRSAGIPINSEGGLVWIWDSLYSGRRSLSLYLDTKIPEHGKAKMCIHGNVKWGEAYFSAGNTAKRLWIPGETYDITGWNDRKISFEFNPNSQSIDTSNAEIQDIYVTYQKEISIDTTGLLTLFSDTSSRLITYRVSGIGSERLYLFKVPLDERFITLIDTVRSGTDGSFIWTDSGGKGTRYLLCYESALRKLPPNEEHSVPGRSKFMVADLYNPLNRTDFLIITHPDFLSAAEKLCEHKKQMGFVNPAIVDINTIYRSFSGGEVDPVAIRNFIQFIHNSGWQSGEELEYVLLMGGAHYDIKKMYANSKCFIPTYYYDETIPQDDFFCRVNGVPVKTIGRIPCRSLRDAEAVVDKIVEYELPGKADFGEWRNRAVYVSDDDMQGKNHDGMGHHTYSAKTAEYLNKCWGSVDLRMVYLFEYGFDASGRKPGASAAIVNQIQNGAGFVCYYGHGSHSLWSDEEVMTHNKISLLSNQKKYPLIASFSCSVGNFDQSGPCLSEAFIFAEKSGAIASIGSSRLSDAWNNGILGNNFFEAVLDTQHSVNSMGYMLTLAKLKAGASSYKYIFMGDPSVKILNALYKIDLNVTDSSGAQIDKIKARQKIRVSGQVSNNGAVDELFGTSQDPAFVQIGLFNPPETASRKDGAQWNVEYQLPGKPIFIGKVPVKNGRFSQFVKIGDNVPFNKPGTRLTAYAWRERTGDAGGGYRDDLVFDGSENSTHDDTAGPQIVIRPLYSDSKMSKPAVSFSDKITSSLPMQCEITIKDESGIDVTGTGPDEGLSYSIQDVVDRRSINSRFQFNEGDFRTGCVVLDFDKSVLEPGEYVMNLWAADLTGNRTHATFNLNIVNENDVSLGKVFNYPNPMTTGGCTRFYFYHSNTSQETGKQIRALIRIYSLTGKLLRVIMDAENGQVWDGRDQRGRTLSPDVYLYQVQVYSSILKKSTKSKVCKLVIHPPH